MQTIDCGVFILIFLIFCSKRELHFVYNLFSTHWFPKTSKILRHLFLAFFSSCEFHSFGRYEKASWKVVIHGIMNEIWHMKRELKLKIQRPISKTSPASLQWEDFNLLTTVIEWAGVIVKQHMTEKGSKHKRDPQKKWLYYLVKCTRFIRTKNVISLFLQPYCGPAYSISFRQTLWSFRNSHTLSNVYSFLPKCS